VERADPHSGAVEVLILLEGRTVRARVLLAFGAGGVEQRVGRRTEWLCRCESSASCISVAVWVSRLLVAQLEL